MSGSARAQDARGLKFGEVTTPVVSPTELPRVARTVSLGEVVAKARANPPAVLAALATLERVRQQEFAAKGAYLPTLAFEARETIGHANQPYLPGLRFKSTSVSTSANASLNYTIFDRRRSGAVRAAEAASEAAIHNSDQARRAAMESAATLYFQALAAVELISDAELTLARRTAQHDSIAALARAGVRPAVDEQRAKVEVVVAQATVEVRKINLATLEAALSAALGEDPLAPVRAGVVADEVLGHELSPRDAVTHAILHRPEVLASEAQVRASVASDDAARGARLPTVGVGGAASMTQADVLTGQGLGGQIINASAWLYLRWSALDATVWRQARVTNAQVREAERALAVTQLQVRNEAVAAALGAENARVKLEQAEQVLAGAQVTRTAQNERYRAGVATLLELLDAEQLEQSARLSRIEAARDYAIARAVLLSATGKLGELVP
jgi:outer membrane protein